MIKDQAEIIKANNCINFLNTCEEFLNDFKLKNVKFLLKREKGAVQKITIRQYRYPYKMTCHKYISDNNKDYEYTPKNAEKDTRKTDGSVQIGGEERIELENFESVNKGASDLMDYVPPSSSFGNFEIPFKAIQEFWSNLFFNVFVDTETVERAVQIAEKSSNKILQTD